MITVKSYALASMAKGYDWVALCIYDWFFNSLNFDLVYFMALSYKLVRCMWLGKSIFQNMYLILIKLESNKVFYMNRAG